MKRVVLLFTVIGFMLFCKENSFSQECDFKLNEKDKFTGKISLLTSSEIVSENGRYVYMEILKTGEDIFLTMNYTERALKANDWTCTKSDPLIFLFRDGEKLTLYPTEQYYKTQKTRMDQFAATFIGNLSVFADKFVFSPRYNISKDELNLLRIKSVSDFRITAKGKSGNTLEKLDNIEFSLNEKSSEVIQKDSKCIIQNYSYSEGDSISKDISDEEKLEEAPYLKVMNPSFAEEYENTETIVNAAFYSIGGWKNYIIPSKLQKYFLFQCNDISSGPTQAPMLGEVGDVFCIDKSKADEIFSLKKGDNIKLRGTTYTHNYFGNKTVYFIVTEIEKL